MTFSELHPWISNFVQTLVYFAVLLAIEGEKVKALMKKTSILFILTFYSFVMLTVEVISKVMPSMTIIVGGLSLYIIAYVFLIRIYNNRPLKAIIKIAIVILLNVIGQVVIMPLVVITGELLDDGFAMKLATIYGPLWVGFFSILVYKKWRHKIEPIVDRFSKSAKLVGIQVSVLFVYIVILTVIVQQYMVNFFHMMIFLILSFAAYLYLAYKLYVNYTTDKDLQEASDS